MNKAFGSLLSAVVTTGAVAGFSLAACVGDNPETSEPNADGGPEGPGADAQTSSSSGSSPDTDGGGSSGLPPATCTTPNTCDGSKLVRCDGVGLGICSLGCVTGAAGGACQSFDPTGPLGPEELAPLGLAAIALDDNFVFDTDTGAVFVVDSNGAQTPFRAPNPGAEYAVDAGIGYRRAEGRSIFYFESFEVRHGTRRNFRGAASLAIVARSSISVLGPWTLPCGALGAVTSGPSVGVDGSPVGSGTTPAGGGGGGGHATAGGKGYATCSPEYDGGQSVACLPGGGGGAGGALAAPTPDWALTGGGNGGVSGTAFGGGGAAVQLVSLGAITIGPGTDAAKAGINVGGCGGGADGNGGGGGGAGGMLLVETPVFNALGNAGVAANGGAGGASAPVTGDLSPSDGPLAVDAARSPTPAACLQPNGGSGAFGILGPGDSPGYFATSCNDYTHDFLASGGGGGGAAGVIHVITTAAAPVSRSASFFTSPDWSIAELPR